MFEKNAYLCSPLHRGVEQLVARRAHNPEVGGSSPPSATKNKALTKSALFYIIRRTRTSIAARRYPLEGCQTRLTG